MEGSYRGLILGIGGDISLDVDMPFRGYAGLIVAPRETLVAIGIFAFQVSCVRIPLENELPGS